MNKKGKEKESSKIENLQRIVKALTNKVIDLNKNSGDSSKKPFKAWKNKINNPKPQEVESINFEEETMDKWCRSHNDYHSKKTCCEFINMHNVV